MTKKLDQYAQCFQKWLRTEKILMKLNICSFFIKNAELLEKHDEIWGKVSNTIKRRFDSEPVYNKKIKMNK